jgi:protein-S-isoprenylcysteine O-methyltransferase Ste14
MDRLSQAGEVQGGTERRILEDAARPRRERGAAQAETKRQRRTRRIVSVIFLVIGGVAGFLVAKVFVFWAAVGGAAVDDFQVTVICAAFGALIAGGGAWLLVWMVQTLRGP